MNKKEFDIQVAKRIKTVMKKKGKVYKQVAPYLGLSLSSFSNKITCSGACFSFFDICNLAKCLNVRIEELTSEKYFI